MTQNIRFQRILAWLVDWVLSGLPTLFFALLLELLYENHWISKGNFILFTCVAILLFPLLFVCKERLCKGHSVGKRMFRLFVFDQKTKKPATIQQHIKRNLFFVLTPLNFLFLLFTGDSLADRFVHTYVMRIDQNNMIGLSM